LVSAVPPRDVSRYLGEELDALDQAPHRWRLWGFSEVALSLFLERSAFFNGDNGIFCFGGAHGSLSGVGQKLSLLS
jgi:hypothetical protein